MLGSLIEKIRRNHKKKQQEQQANSKPGKRPVEKLHVLSGIYSGQDVSDDFDSQYEQFKKRRNKSASLITSTNCYTTKEASPNVRNRMKRNTSFSQI